jgi:hypothetical protein
MKTNIEKSDFRPGEYVGYSAAGVQRIRRFSAGWKTYALGSSAGRFVYLSAPTLADLSTLLDAIV